MITVYETEFFGPDDSSGQRIKVTNTRTSRSRWHMWDYAVNHGPDQHQHAVHEATELALDVVYGGETKRGYLWVGIPWDKEEDNGKI